MCSVKSNLKWFWILYWNGCGDNQNVCIFAVLWYKQVLMNFWSKYKTLQYIMLLTHFATWIWRLNKPVSKWVKLFNMCCIQKKGVQFTECFRLCNGRNVFWNAYLSTQNICLVCDLNRTPNCYGKTWRFLCPFFRNLHLRENLARDCFTSTVSTVTNSVQNIFTHLRYCDRYAMWLIGLQQLTHQDQWHIMRK